MRRLLSLSIAVIIIGIVAIAGVFILRSRSARIVTLPNGLQVELLGITPGRQTFSTERTWQRQARKILPRRWQSWIPPAVSGQCSNGTNSIAVYLRVVDPSGATIVGQPWTYYAAEDDGGFVYPREGGSCTFGGTPPSRIEGLTLRAFPRRQSHFVLKLLDAEGTTMVRFRVSNPLAGPFPEWQPLPLPQTNTNGPVALTLEGLEEKGSDSWRYVKPKWNLTAAETNWTNARPRYFTLIDSTGNEGSWLSPRESAWKVRTQVFRERLQDFGPGEYASFTNVSIPEPGECVKFNQTFELNEVSLVIHALGGRGSIASTNGGSWGMVPNDPGGTGHSSSSSGTTTIRKFRSLNPFLLFEVNGVRPHDEIRLQVNDNSGNEVKVENSGWSQSSTGSRMYIRRFEPGTNGQSLDFEIIVNRPLEFEFLVNPADVTTSTE